MSGILLEVISPMNPASTKPMIVFSSFAPSIYGTERILLAIAENLKPEFDTCILSPPGPLQEAAAKVGVTHYSFLSKGEFARHIRELYRGHRELAFFATGVWHTLVITLLNLAYRRKIANFHIVQGGSTERDSYSRKHYLKSLKLRYVCPSEFVKERLAAHGVPGSRVDVIPNFLSPSHIAAMTPRGPFESDGVHRAVVVSRLDPIKRVDVLLDALERHADLRDLPISIVGGGPLADSLPERAKDLENVKFTGPLPSNETLGMISKSDLLIHLCPEEPFGLVFLEAMASRVPTLGATSGAAATIIKDGETGYTFQANEPDSLAETLRRLRTMPAETLNKIVEAAKDRLESEYSMPRCIAAFRSLILAQLK